MNPWGLTPLLRGLEIGLAHGYFLIGPFAKLGPLRDSDIGLLAGFLSTIGLILILTLGLTIYGEITTVFPNLRDFYENHYVRIVFCVHRSPHLRRNNCSFPTYLIFTRIITCMNSF